MPPPVPPSVNAGRMMSGKPADLFRHGAGFVQVVRGAGNRHVEADGQHQVLERLPVFALVDGLGLGADHFDAVFFQHAGSVQGHRGVERGLAAERGQQNEFMRGLGFGVPALGNAHFLHLVHLADDDFFDAFGRDGLDVGAVGELRVGHDGGRVGVDEHDAVAFLLERLAGLRAGIIELARLADDDRAGADDEDAMNVSALGHRWIYDIRFTIGDLKTAQTPTHPAVGIPAAQSPSKTATDETRIRRGAKANCSTSPVAGWCGWPVRRRPRHSGGSGTPSWIAC